MFCQQVEEKYEKWNEHHPASEIEFEPREQMEAGGMECQQSIILEIATAEKEKLKDWDIYPMKTLKVLGVKNFQ